MGVIETQCDSDLKVKFNEFGIPEFYKYFPASSENTHVSMFGSFPKIGKMAAEKKYIQKTLICALFLSVLLENNLCIYKYRGFYMLFIFTHIRTLNIWPARDSEFVMLSLNNNILNMYLFNIIEYGFVHR